MPWREVVAGAIGATIGWLLRHTRQNHTFWVDLTIREPDDDETAAPDPPPDNPS